MAVPEGFGAAFVFVLSKAGATLWAARLFLVLRRCAAVISLRDPPH